MQLALLVYPVHLKKINPLNSFACAYLLVIDKDSLCGLNSCFYGLFTLPETDSGTDLGSDSCPMQK